MLERRPALGTEDVAWADARAADCTTLIIAHPRRRGDGPGPGRLCLGRRFVTGRGAPGGPYRLIVLSARRIQGALPRTLDLSCPSMAIVDKRALPVSRPWLRLAGG